MEKITRETFRTIFLALAFTVLLIHITSLYPAYKFTQFQIKTKFVQEPGIEFKEFIKELKGVKKIGFLTDKDMSPERNDGQFLAAQYMLSPIILDLNNPNCEFIIFDYTSMAEAYKKIKEIGAVLMYANRYGKILAKKL